MLFYRLYQKCHLTQILMLTLIRRCTRGLILTRIQDFPVCGHLSKIPPWWSPVGNLVSTRLSTCQGFKLTSRYLNMTRVGLYLHWAKITTQASLLCFVGDLSLILLWLIPSLGFCLGSKLIAYFAISRLILQNHLLSTVQTARVFELWFAAYFLMLRIYLILAGLKRKRQTPHYNSQKSFLRCYSINLVSKAKFVIWVDH